MSFPDMTDLSNAYVLCSCTGECHRSCTVCRSPSWQLEGCVKELWLKHVGPLAAGTYPRTSTSWGEGGPEITVPPHIPHFDVFPHHRRTDAIEKWIDLMDQEVGLEPWQAKLIRWILRGSKDNIG